MNDKPSEPLDKGMEQVGAPAARVLARVAQSMASLNEQDNRPDTKKVKGGGK